MLGLADRPEAASGGFGRAPAGAPTGRRPPLADRYLLPLIVACALFVENLDSTVLSTSLPAIASDFHESPIDLKLALTSYLLALAVGLPASGWLADRFGARHILDRKSTRLNSSHT